MADRKKRRSGGKLGQVAAFLRQEIQAARVVHDDFRGRDYLLAAAAWTAGAGWALPSLTTLTLLGNRGGLAPERMQALYKLYSSVQLALLGVRWRAHVDPAVDPARPYFFMQNHVNHFDFITCHNATPHFRQGIELESHFAYPLYGPFMRSRGTVPVYKGERGQTGALTARIGREIDAGRSILGFPEGTRTLDGRVGPFRSGLFFIARDLGVPIVPVTVTGMWEVMRKGSIMIRPFGRVDCYVDAPLPTAGLSDAEIPALVQRVRERVAGRVDDYYAERSG